MKKKTILLGFLAIWCGLSILSAQVTIGKDVPAQATLDIIGDTANIHGQAFRLIDGNQGSGKIIMSNAGGIGTWTGAQQLLSQIPFIDIPQFFEARTGWTILTYGCQRYGRVFQFRLRIQNTTAISFDALTHKPLSNSLIAKTHIPPMRYIFYDAYPYSPTPDRNLNPKFVSTPQIQEKNYEESAKIIEKIVEKIIDKKIERIIVFYDNGTFEELQTSQRKN
jgi:hypothetical protein